MEKMEHTEAMEIEGMQDLGEMQGQRWYRCLKCGHRVTLDRLRRLFAGERRPPCCPECNLYPPVRIPQKRQASGESDAARDRACLDYLKPDRQLGHLSGSEAGALRHAKRMQDERPD